MNPTLLGFLRKEFIQTLRDPRMRILLFLAPVIQLILFGYALSNEVRDIRLAVAAPPGDAVASRLLVRAEASGWFIPERFAGDDPVAWIQSGRAEAVLVAPPGGFRRALVRGDLEVQLLLDMTNMIRGRSIERYLRGLMARVLQDMRPSGGETPRLAFNVRILYNPGMETALFLVPGVMVMLLCILTILLTSMAIVREKEMGTFETLVSAPVRNWEILLGKTLPFVILALVVGHLILLAAMLLFDLPMRGAYWKFFAAVLVFIGTTVSVGTLISTIARSQQQAMMGSFLFLFPAIMLSGLMFPVENMPPALIGVAYLNPLKYMLTLLRNIFLKGGDPWVFAWNLTALALLAVVAMAASFKRFRQTLN